jgi:Domain of unknown function (DUF4149)
VRGVFRVLLVLWAGSLWSLAAWVAPTLFYAQSDRHLAGLLAARLFAVETYVGVGTALLAAALPGRGRFKWGYAAAALLAVNQWALGPIMAEARARGAAAGLTFGAWHGVSVVIYVLACLAVAVLICKERFD